MNPMHSSDAEPASRGRVSEPTTPVRAFGRVATECALGGMFFGGLFGAAVGVVFAVVAGIDLGAEGLGATAALMVAGAPSMALIGCVVGIVLGLGYGIAVGVGTGAVMAAVAGNRRAHLPVGHLRLVAALAAALSALIGVTSVMLINGGGDASLADERPLVLTVLVVFVLAPGAIAAGFAAWRSSGWMPPVEDAAAPQRR